MLEDTIEEKKKKKKGGGFLTRAGGLEISEGPSQVFGRLNGPEREVGGGRLIRVVARAGRWGGAAADPLGR